MPVCRAELYPTNPTHTATLHCEDFGLSHGIWTHAGGGEMVPPEAVSPGAVGQFQSDSDGAGTGTEGRVNYRIEVPGVGTIGHVGYHWNNPIVGRNLVEAYGSVTNPAFLVDAFVNGFSELHPDGYTFA